MDPTIWTSKEIVASVIATGLISAVLTNLCGGIRDAVAARSKNRMAASYMAMRLAVILEAYTTSCARLIQENSSAEHLADEEFHEWDARLPILPAYPEDADGWRAVRRDLVDGCLRLPNIIAGSQAMIFSVIEHQEERAETEVQEYAADLGLRAWRLAVALRKASGLPPGELVWDAPAMLGRVLDHVESERGIP